MNTDKHRSEKAASKRRSGASIRSAGLPLFPLPFFLFVLVSAFICVHLWFPPCALAGQRVVDRIVATIEGEPIMASELTELGRFQQLLGGPDVSEKELMRRRIEQWIVATDAESSRFPRPQPIDVDRELGRLMSQYPSAQAYQARLRELGLRPESVRRLLERQLYLSRYLDSRFRPTVQIEEKQVEAYYRGEFTKQVAARGQSLPPLRDVREQILELLTQREISERAGRWLDESRPRIRVVPQGSVK